MTIRLYASTDSSAPTLSGTAGDMINLLDKILVAGYGSQTAAGWTKPYTTTNVAVFQQGSGSNGYVMRVDDTGATVTGGARDALVRGAESASAHSTVVDPFPLTSQVADTICAWRKSSTADATTRVWRAVADATFILLWVNFGSNLGDLYFFGDVPELYTGDSYNTMIWQRNDSVAGNGSSSLACATTGAYSSTFVQTKHWVRSRDGTIKSVTGQVHHSGTSIGNLPSGCHTYPSTNVSSKLLLRKVLASESYSTTTTTGTGGHYRGVIPCYFDALVATSTSLAHLDTFSDSNYNSNFLILIGDGNAGFAPGAARTHTFQTSGTFDAS